SGMYTPGVQDVPPPIEPVLPPPPPPPPPEQAPTHNMSTAPAAACNGGTCTVRSLSIANMRIRVQPKRSARTRLATIQPRLQAMGEPAGSPAGRCARAG